MSQSYENEAFSKYRVNIWIWDEELWVGGTYLGPILVTKCYLRLKDMKALEA